MLTEQALRRVSTELYNGPAQALALALLRLDELRDACEQGGAGRDFWLVRRAVHDALAELRSISAGLRLPDLAPLSLKCIAERIVANHQYRNGASVKLVIDQGLPDQAPAATKIALLRILQEALANATLHAGGIGLCATLRAERDVVWLSVSDTGPGFEPSAAERAGRFGLVAMRERAELLGGTFALESTPGRGTTVRVGLPLGVRD